MADMFDLELHEDDRSGQDNKACCESDDDIIEIDDVSAVLFWRDSASRWRHSIFRGAQ